MKENNNIYLVNENEQSSFNIYFELYNFSEEIEINIKLDHFYSCNIIGDEAKDQLKSIILNHSKILEIANKIIFTDDAVREFSFFMSFTYPIIEVNEMIGHILTLSSESGFRLKKIRESNNNKKSGVNDRGYFITLFRVI